MRAFSLTVRTTHHATVASFETIFFPELGRFPRALFATFTLISFRRPQRIILLPPLIGWPARLCV
jgi:hypothetical protein